MDASRIGRLAFVSMATALAGCTFSRMTMIDSKPQGADVFYKTQLKGTTPTAMRMPCVGLQGGDDPLAGFGDSVIELRKPGFRPTKFVVDGNWRWNNIVFGGLIGVLLWAKCPGESYMYQLETQRSELEGKATVTVARIPAGMTLAVDGMAVVVQTPIILDADVGHEVEVYARERLVNRGTFSLTADTDYVTTLAFRSNRHAARTLGSAPGTKRSLR